MKTRVTILAGLLAMSASVLAFADQKEEQQKYCAAIAALHSDVGAFEGLGQSSTIAEVRAAVDRIQDAAKEVTKAAGKIKSPTADLFSEAVKRLHTDMKSIPDNATVAQAHTTLQGDTRAVQDAAKKLAAESGCPAPQPPQ
jgi:hypothetical protein